MVLVGDVYVMTGPHIVTDIDSQMTNYAATTANQATIANTYNRVGQALLPRQHPSRKRHILADHRVISNVYVVLVENGCDGKADNAVDPKAPKLLTPGSIWSNRTMQTQPVPRIHCTLLAHPLY